MTDQPPPPHDDYDDEDDVTREPPPLPGIIRWFADNDVAANILMLLFVIGGIVAALTMRSETFPAIDPRLVTVSVVYPGATPDEVADSITNRVEEAVLGIDGVERIASTAREGVGIVRVELEDFANADDVFNETETAVNGLIDFPPEDAERPIITKVRVTPNVLTLALHGDVEERALKYWAETVEDEVLQLPGVAVTNLRGLRDDEMSLEIPEEALRRYDLSLDDVTAAVQGFSNDIPAGTLESRQGDILLRVQERRYTGQEFGDIVVRTLPDGSRLRMKDIGRAVDGFADVNLVSKFNGEPAAFLDVKRAESGDTLAVAETVKAYLHNVKLPEGIKATLQKDETVNLENRMSLMLRNGLIGFVLVFLILLLFLDLKLAFWTSAAIPISFLGGLMLLQFMGYSINMISLFALIVVLGIVVDDGIVTGESIFHAQRRNPNDPHAVLRGVRSIMAPVTIGVTTTMAAFGPLIFSTGTLGQIIRVIPVVVIAILFVSLLEAFFILPAHLRDSRQWSRGVIADIRDGFDARLTRFIDRMLLPTIRSVIRWRYAVVAGFVAVAIIVIGLVVSGVMRFIFFPQIEANEIKVTVELPVGTPFDVTKDTLLTIEEEAMAVRDQLTTQGELTAFESIALSIGQTGGGGDSPVRAGSSSQANHIGEMRIQLVPSELRSQGASEISARIRKRVEDLPNIETLEFVSSPIGGEPDIEVELTHPDEQRLIDASQELREQISQIQGSTDVSDSFEPGKMEYVFELNAQGLSLGLTPLELGRQLRSAYFGNEAQRIQRGSSELIVYVRYPKEDRERLRQLEQTRIRLPGSGASAPLSSVADIKEQRGFARIETVNGKRVVSVTADADLSVATPNQMMEILKSETLPALKARYQGLDYTFEGESREQQKDLASLGRNMLIALMIIYVLLGSQLRSYVQPFVIMMAIPFGIVGAIIGHLLLGYDLTFISMFGMVALTGVVVNDSVVLIDYLNHHYREGYNIGESAILAVKRRFRPILLTTMSTSLGLLPMLLETSLQARFLIPMVVSLAMGILFSTFVILLLVPSLVVIVHDVRVWLVRMGGRSEETSRSEAQKHSVSDF